ncbi:MAG: nuclear transport factor 2 family protein, partial [Deltaproteobacteria bacterium]|nr:nuclear transport factor 2 family protein [Deltaproteobacteria bacterium]
RGAVAALLSREGGGPGDVDDAGLDARLESLRRSELIERDTGWFLGEPVLRFHHVLIRDAAYRRLLKGTRAALHEQLADWIEGQAGDAAEHDETIGWHLELAHQHLRELGPMDAKGRGLGERAAQRLAAAGRRALSRDDLPVAADLLGRSIDLLDADDAARADLALDWCEALLAGGDVGTAGAAIAELGRFVGEQFSVGPAVPTGAQPRPDSVSDPAGTAGPTNRRLAAWHTCFAAQLTALTAPQELQAAADSVAVAAQQLAALGDAAGEAKAHAVHATALARLGKVGACEAALDQALAAARKAGDRRRANAVLAGAPLAALWGPSPVTRASGRCLDVVRVLRITQGAPAVESVALSCQGVLEALRGRTEAARRMLASSRKMVEDLGIANRLFEADAFAGRIAMMEGDDSTAERLLRSAYEGLRDLGLGIDAARAGALLARVLLAQHRAAEAEALSHESEALAGDDIQAAIAWRGVRAEALAQRGEHAAAIELAQAAVAIAAATDALLDHADARLALAAALRAAGRHDDAHAERRQAIALWEAKGATRLAERVRDGTPDTPPAEAEQPRPPAPPAGAPSAAPVRRRVLPNAATRNAERWFAAIQAGDDAALRATNSAELETVHHPTGATYGADDAARTFPALAGGRNMRMTQATLAALGDSLALVRRSYAHDGHEARRGSIGPVEGTYLVVVEVDQRELMSRSEVFADDHLGDAIARLYQRHAERLPEGPQRRAAAVTAEAVTHMLTSWVAPDLSLLFAPDYADIDHRTVGYAALSPTEVQHLARSFHDLADNLRFHLDDVFALTPHGLVRQTTATGTWRDGGGAFERTVCALTLFGDDGRVTRHETFDGERAADALAHFDALQESAQPAPDPPAGQARAAPARLDALVAPADAPCASPFANAASRSLDREMHYWAAHDWEGLQSLVSPAIRFHDRRRLLHVEVGFEQFTAQQRLLFEQPRSRWIEPMIATRGERLSLHRVVFEAEVAGGGGPLEIENHLVVVEVDAAGRWTALVLFDRSDEAAAWAELERRFDAAEGAAYPAHAAVMRAFAAAVASGDWDPVVGLCAPAFVEHDHRGLAVLGTTRGAAAWAQNFRALTALAPDTIYRVDHFRSHPRGFCSAGTWTGTRDGGRYEIPVVAIIELDADGRLARADIYDREQAAPALARFAELSDTPTETATAAPRRDPLRIPPNAVTALLDRWATCGKAHDWDGLARLYAPAAIFDDRRRLMRLRGDRTQAIASARVILESGRVAVERTTLATAGDRLSLDHWVWRGGKPGSDFVVETLTVTEVDADGLGVAWITFDADDRAAASAELFERYAGGAAAALLPATEFFRAVNSRDIARARAAIPADFVFHDHRRTGIGRIAGAADYSAALAAVWELSPDARLEGLYEIARAPHGRLGVDRTVGSNRTGGEFESVYVSLVHVIDGRLAAVELFEPEHLDAARARFAALGAAPPVAALPLTAANAATATIERWRLGISDGGADWEALRASLAPGLVFEDRQGFARLVGDRAMMIASLRERVASGARPDVQLVGTAGERVAIVRMLWTGGPADGRFEIEYVSVTEADAAGLVIACILFAADDRRGAQREAWARWATIEPAAGAPTTLFGAVLDTANAHDLARYRALFAADVVVEDRRHGLRIAGRDDYAAQVAQLWEHAPDARIDGGWFWPAVAPHGAVTIARRSGALADEFLWLFTVDDGRIARIEVFGLDDVDAARARLAELRPD